MDVDIERLKQAASTFSRYGADFRSKAVPAVDRCQIPWTAIPEMGQSFKEQYTAGWQELDLAMRAMPDLLETIGKSLDRVANHYLGTDEANAKAFTPPTMPEIRTMNGTPGAGEWAAQGSVTLATGLTTFWGDKHAFGTLEKLVGLVAKAKEAGVVLKVGALPFALELLAAVVAVDLFAVSNMRDPLPYFSAADGWGEIETLLNAAVADLPQLSYDIVYKVPQWSGDGANAFYAFMNDDLDRTLAAMVGLNNAMQTACIEAAWSMTFAIIAYIAISLTTGTVCNLAKLIPDPTAMTQISVTHAALVMFMEYAVAILIDLGQLFLFLTLAATQMRQASDTLKSYLTDKDGDLNGRSLQLTVQELQSISGWESWDRKKQ